MIVVGAGASGQMAAIAAAEGGCRVLLLERMGRAGLKVVASGGGRCNLTHLCTLDDLRAAYGRQGRFADPSMAGLPPEAVRELMARMGVPTVVEDGRVFPSSGRATDVQSALRRRLDELGVEVRCDCGVRRLAVSDGRVVGAEAATGRMDAAAVVLACGGCGYPKLGGSKAGYDLARQAGHEIVDPKPALAPLVTQEKWPSRLAGVRLPDVRVRIDRRGESKAGLTGDLLLTHRGVSGPVILDLSGRVAELLADGPVGLRVELLAGVDVSQWRRRLTDARSEAGAKTIARVLQVGLPASLCDELIGQAGADPSSPVAQLSSAAQNRLAELLGSLPLRITATEGFGAAMVTRGGVKLAEVDPNTLASRRADGLFLAGEMLDLDGPCGGYNLQWAFASGDLAGRSAAESRERSN